jgi:hypothetical protein
MTIDKLYKNSIFRLPKERGDKTYCTFLKEILNEYKNLIKELDNNSQIYPDVELICNGLLETVRIANIGFLCKAYCQLGKVLSKIVTNEQYALTRMNIPLYRIRKFKTTTEFPSNDNELMKELFHIPFNKIENVGNERYSISGHPSLYLGSSIYTCCEELNITKQDIKTGLVYCSRFESNDMCNNGPIQLLDLRTKQCKNEKDRHLYLNLFPLIMACSVAVKEKDKPFKPEYTIPQLVLEWVRNNAYPKINEKIIGIAYSSTKITMEDTDCPEKFYNVVLPAGIPSKENTYCDKLRNILKMTVPTKLSHKCGCLIKKNVVDIDNPNKPHENCYLEQEKHIYTNSMHGYMEEIIDKNSLTTIDINNS